MCGRYYRRSDKQRIAEAFKLGKLPDGFVLPPDYNVAPTSFQPVIREQRDARERELVMMRWGLVPNFAKSLADFKGMSTINAKAETLSTSATWRVPFQRRRCLVPADGFYEWQLLDAKTRQPYAFMMRDDRPFAFAGLWDAWKDPANGEWLQSYAIITTDPNELTMAVHNRMPVILEPKDYSRWLSRDETERLPVDLLRPFAAEEMAIRRVGAEVGNVRNNYPELLETKEI
jgi:putative SOS response-associated peptidase YedK